MYIDLRSWLEGVENQGELRRIVGASWDLEMGSIAEIVFKEARNPKPAILFNSIPGFPKGFRTLMSLLGSPFRIAKTLGLPEDQIDHLSLLNNWRKKAKELTLIPPKLITSGPVQANSDVGDQVNLLKFPVPRFHELDGGRYIGTCHTVIQKDPDDSWMNLAPYRVMLVDRNRLTLHVQQGKHGSIIMHKKYFDKGRVMPIAVAIGVDPALFWSACQSVRWGVSEYNYAGGIKGEPIDVFEGPYTGLPLPAQAEIVIEGECYPGELADEGPFGEWHGYYANLGLAPAQEPIIRVKAVHYRDNPILTCVHPCLPPSEISLMLAIAASGGIWENLEGAGIPGIKGVWCHELGCGMLFNVVSIEQMYGGHARQVGLIASQWPGEAGRYTIVVEEDIDPFNLEQVIWAIVTRTQPDRSIQILPHCRSGNSDPTIPLAEKTGELAFQKPFTSSRVVINACRDMEWKSDWYPMSKMSPGLRKEVLEKWQPVLSDLL
jgi:4-hydroxy-3-polyprenylbenzoate decarboxylase